MQKLSGKVAVVTGGSSGIGLATAKLFAEAGAKVVIFARSETGLAEARALVPGMTTIAGDVTRAADVERLFQETRAKLGGVDVLVANAAVVKLASIADTSDALFDEVVSTNLKGAYYTLRQGAKVLNENASVILTTSFLNRIGFAGASVVSMTKAALRSLVRVAAAELAPRRVRVNAVCPGAIETPLWGKLGLPEDALRAAGGAITAQTPAGRWGTPEEVARAMLFLASDESSYVNGSELSVDGGFRQT